AYSGRLRGSSDGGVRCRSASGSNRCRLASPRNTKRPRIKRTARTSQRLNKRAQSPTVLGTNTRMSYGPAVTELSLDAAVTEPTAARLGQIHNIRAAAFNP